jgi:CheY-like chemotaxis protein
MADRHRERAFQLGATAYMGKPYFEQALLTLLAQIMTEPVPSATSDDQDFFTTA